MNPNFQQDLEHWVVMELGGKVSGAWANLKAPCHQDGTASGRIKLENGWFWCQACGEGCWSDQLAKEYNLAPPPLKEPGKSYEEANQNQSVIAAEYVYRDADGEPLYKCVKRVQNGKKNFAQAKWTGADWDFTSGALDDVDRVLFDLPELLTSTGPVLFVEGEKDVRAAQRLGFTATTAPQGAGKGKADKVSDWSALLGREVVIIPDNDKPGREHADRVEYLLKDVAAKVEILMLPDQPEKGDLSDWMARGGKRAQLEEYVGHLLSHATPSRRWVEQSYIVSAWDDEVSLQALAAFSITRWRDKASRLCVQAVKNLIETDRPLEPVTIGEEMKDLGGFHLYEALVGFEAQLARTGKLRKNSKSIKDAFTKATAWDDIGKIILDAHKTLGKGDPARALAELFEKSGELLRRHDEKKDRTLDQILEEVLQEIIRGEDEKEQVWIPFLSDLMGYASGGDVVGVCGAPKFGKSFVLRQIREDLAKAGVPTLTSQLELSEEQVAEREFRSKTGDFNKLDASKAEEFSKKKAFGHHKVSWFSTIGDSIETCKAEVWGILQRHPEIKVWLMDYNERIYELSKGSSQYQEAQRVAKFVKDTAKRFGVVVIVLLQPNNKYHDEGGVKGPRPSMIDYGNKWVKDVYALWFMHRPSKFDAGAPEDLCEFHLIASRGSDVGVVYGQFKPEWSRFFIHPDSDTFRRQAAPMPKPASKTKGVASGPKFEDHKDERFETIEGEDRKAIGDLKF